MEWRVEVWRKEMEQNYIVKVTGFVILSPQGVNSKEARALASWEHRVLGSTQGSINICWLKGKEWPWTLCESCWPLIQNLGRKLNFLWAGAHCDVLRGRQLWKQRQQEASEDFQQRGSFRSILLGIDACLRPKWRAHWIYNSLRLLKNWWTIRTFSLNFFLT